MRQHAHKIPDEGSLAERLVNRSIPVTECGCWIWLLDCKADGYGKMKFKGRTLSASRASWEAFRGPIPEGMHVLHHCDVRACINPDHLFLGTNADNVVDRVLKDRTHRWYGRRRGENNPNHRSRKIARTAQ